MARRLCPLGGFGPDAHWVDILLVHRPDLISESLGYTHVGNRGQFDECQDRIFHAYGHAEAMALGKLTSVIQKPFGEIVCLFDNEKVLSCHVILCKFSKKFSRQTALAPSAFRVSERQSIRETEKN